MHKRDLPWRKTRDPYRIWISETILQQTRVAQGLPYYERFLERFPSVRELALAEESEVLKLWQGLGYYSRARNLHKAAIIIHEKYHDRFPADYSLIRDLPGIGDYTAAAIASFATDAPHAVVDGKVYRLLSRLLDIDTPIDTTAGKKQFATAADTLLQEYLSSPGHAGAGSYNQAVMELGALVCTPRNPNCDQCPLSSNCLALKNGTADRRPVKKGKAVQTPRYFHYLHLTDPCGRTVIHRRAGNDIWHGLYEFPLVETATDTEIYPDVLPFAATWRSTIRMPRHLLSHRIIHATFHRIETDDLTALPIPEDWIVIPSDHLGDYAIARLTELYLARIATTADPR